MCHIKQLCDEVAPLNLLAGVVAPQSEAHWVNISRPHEWHKGTSPRPQFQCVNCIKLLVCRFINTMKNMEKEYVISMLMWYFDTDSSYCMASIFLV